MDPHQKLMPPKSPLKRWWFRAMVYVVVGYIAWCIILYLYQDRLLFPAEAVSAPRTTPKDAEIISVHAKDGGRCVSWFIPAESGERAKAAPVVIYFHGNAELIDDQESVVAGYRRLGVSVFLPEYPGYGRSAGKPSQKSIGEVACGFFDALVQRPDVDRSRIVFHGRSIGGGVAADLATRRKPAALILESTFSSVARMALSYGAPPFLVKSPFRTDLAIARMDIPMLIFHGTQDNIIPVAHGRRLRDAAPKATYVEYNSGHNDFPGAGNEQAYWSEIRKFLRGAGIAGTSRPG